jgi:hypothetical protein
MNEDGRIIVVPTLDTTPAQRRGVNMILHFCATGDRALLEETLQHGPIDWGYTLYFADINGLLGMLWKMTNGLDDSRVPFRVAVTLANWIKKQRNRWHTYLSLLRQLMDDAPLTKPPILLKGAALKKTIYRERPEIRTMGDIDLLITPADEPATENWLTEQGFWLRAGKNGSTAFKDLNGEHLVVDLHIGDPAKTKRAPESVYDIFVRYACKDYEESSFSIVSHEVALVHACKHFCEHEDDFRKVFLQDDLRLFRLLDIRLLLDHVDLTAVSRLAQELKWEEEVSRCRLYLAELFDEQVEWRGPRANPPSTLSTPLGNVVWPWCWRERARRVDRSEWLASCLGDQGYRTYWYTWRTGNKAPDWVASDSETRLR